MKNQMQILENIVKHNYKQLEMVNFDQGYASDLFIISHNGHSIYDFFVDETMRDCINPFEYYPKDELIKVISLYLGGK